MLRIFGTRNTQYSGSSCYRHVERLISKGKKVLIVSPYVDDYYAGFLLAKSPGRDIRLLSSSVDERVRRKLEGRIPRYRIALYSIFMLLFEYLLYRIGAGVGYMLLYFMVIAGALFVISIPRRIKLKVPRNFVHAKLYVSEDEAIRGSANLTYKGLHKNIEHIEIVRDRKDVDSMRREFWRMWNSS
ncbi:MAG: hypothetical protein KGI00_04165 [Candidatus Micrarchaeota archaeon]|nr:hypothetical protein [Candidatus Micrarchaeota archaeon]MDE1849895.1 hypothetical protein [Candidatus Micrarchaeota archaeon]